MGRIVLVVLALAAGVVAQTLSGGLTGTVADESGGIIPNAKIVTSGLSSGTGMTGSSGEFRITGLEPGLYKLTITSAGFLPKEVSGRVQENQTTALGEIRMKVAVTPCNSWVPPKPAVVVRKREHGQHGTFVYGAVRDWNKLPVARAFVRVQSTAEPDSATMVRTDQNGRFEVTGLKPGIYRLSVGFGNFDPVRIQQIVVRDGFEVRIEDILMGFSTDVCL